MKQVAHIISTDNESDSPHQDLVQDVLFTIGEGEILHVKHGLSMDENFICFSTLIIWEDGE